MINRSILYAIVGVLAVAVGVLGYSLYHERNKPEGVSYQRRPRRAQDRRQVASLSARLARTTPEPIPAMVLLEAEHIRVRH
jgi:hypothetical protein